MMLKLLKIGQRSHPCSCAAQSFFNASYSASTLFSSLMSPAEEKLQVIQQCSLLSLPWPSSNVQQLHNIAHRGVLPPSRHHRRRQLNSLSPPKPPTAIGEDSCQPSLDGSYNVRHFSTTSRITSLFSADHIVRSPKPDLDIPTDLPFHQYIYNFCDKYKDIVFLEEFVTGKTYTYAQTKDKSIKLASALYRKGYRKGDVLLVFAPNQNDFVLLALACSALGVWFSPANPAFSSAELARQMQLSKPMGVFTVPALTETVKKALQRSENPGSIKDFFVFGESEGYEPIDALLEDDGKAFPHVEIDPRNDVFVLPYSSGTTGLPKGVMLTHYNCLANCMQCADAFQLTPEDRCLGLLPLYHIYGLIVIQFSIAEGGSRLTFLPKFEPQLFLQCLQETKITAAHLVPPLVLFLAKHPVVDKFDLSHLRNAISGAAPLGKDLTLEFNHRFKNTKLMQGYGLTETSPVTNCDIGATPGSVGHMVANTLGKMIDLSTGKTLPPGKEGEFCCKGPQVMKGYYHNQEATDDMISPDGWLRTGDIGYFDDDGKAYIVDRLKELIKYKGSQVAPAELEAILVAHPDIMDAAVIGVPDAEAGEVPKAYVVKKPDSAITEEAIMQYTAENVSNAKKLRGGVEFISEIPKTASGKILRRILKAKAH